MDSHSPIIQMTAFHEAGHVVGALAEGNRVVSVQVSRSNPGSGVAYIIYKRHKNPFNGEQVAPESAWQYALERQLGVVRSLLAGPLAEAKCTGKPMRSLGSMSDFERCLKKIEKLQPYHEYLCAIGGDLAAFDPYEVVNRERTKVRRWLARRKVWTCITWLAEHLTHRECLRENEILWICAGVPDLDNSDQQSLFVRSAGYKRYEKPTPEHFLVSEDCPVWIMPERKGQGLRAHCALPKNLTRAAGIRRDDIADGYWRLSRTKTSKQIDIFLAGHITSILSDCPDFGDDATFLSTSTDDGTDGGVIHLPLRADSFSHAMK